VYDRYKNLKVKIMKLNGQFFSSVLDFLIDKIRFFREITREKRKKYQEMRGIEPQSAGCEFRVLTITPL
jgi:hypothetical protein